MPQSTVPGEKTSPTQPFPVKPPPLARNSLKRSELPTTISPEHTAYCQGLWEKYKLQDSVPYTPWKLDQDVVVFPGAIGGGNWNGVAYNKKLGLHDHQRDERGAVGASRGAKSRRGPRRSRWRTPAAASVRRWARRASGRRPRWRTARGERPAPPFRKVTPGRRTLLGSEDAVFVQRQPPWGELDRRQRQHRRHRVARAARRVRRARAEGHQDRAAEPRRRDHTAGDLVFIARDDRRLLPRLRRAQRRRSCGDEARRRRRTRSRRPTWASDGKQYVVITAGGGGFLRSPPGDAVVAFRLP